MLKFVSLYRIKKEEFRCVVMSQEPSIEKQLNSIIDYLHYQGPIFLKLPSDRDTDEID